MLKKLILITILLLFIVGILGGCTQNSNIESDQSLDRQNILGTWVNVTNSIDSSGINQSFMRIYNFTENIFNYTYYATIGSDRYYASTEGLYELRNGTLILSNSTVVPPKKATFQYFFSFSNTALSLTDESGNSIVYIKFLFSEE